MSLLPRSHRQFQLKEYWNTFFTKRNVPFEWYGEYLDLCHVLHKYLKPQNKLLVVGCGNSKLSEDLYDAGIHAIDNIDISEVVIKQMTARNKDKRPNMTYHVMDMLNMGYKDCSYDCVLDKGTLDAVFTDETEKTIEKVDKMFTEVERILKIGGRYLCVSLAQEHILDKLMLSFGSGWVVRVHKIDQSGGGSSVGSRLPVFVFVMTKMAIIQGRPPLKVFEYVSESGKCVRCSAVDGLTSFVKDCQQFALVRHNLSSIQVGEQFHVDLWNEDVDSEPRYTLTVVDVAHRKAKNGQFAIFIAPWGRETDWIFSSESGRKELAESAGFDRLVLVTLHRGHTYHGLDQVKEEVSSKALELAQENLPEGRKWPVLTLGEGIGSLRVLYEDSSPFNGKFVVEESELPGQDGCVRRLVFTSSPHLAQTEVVMVSDVKTKKSTCKSRSRSSGGAAVGKIIDHTHLMFGHHTAMIAALALVDGLTQSKRGGIHTLTVGLGGGALSAFIDKFLPQFSQVVVEQDHKMVDVASKWFGLPAQITVHVGDGVEHVKKLASDVSSQGAYSVVILDVDSKDHSIGLSSPPLSFLSEEFLANVKNILCSNGILITNMCARNKELRSKALSSLLCVFKALLVLSVPKDINEVVIGLLEWREDLLGEDNRTASEGVPSSSRMFSQEMKQLAPFVERVTSLSSCLTSVPSERLKTVKQELLDSFDNVSLYC